MSKWSKEDLEEMFGDDIIDQLAFLAGCRKHRLSNDKAIPDGWIIPDESLRKFAELIVRECVDINKQELAFNAFERLFNRYQEHFGVE
jgi:hypothetical protein